MSTADGFTDADRADFLAHYTAPGGMRGGFQHYATLLEDGETNRSQLQAEPPSRLGMPVLVLNGDRAYRRPHCWWEFVRSPPTCAPTSSPTPAMSTPPTTTRTG